MKRILSLLIVLCTIFPTYTHAYVYNQSHTMQNQLESARMKTVSITTAKIERYTWDTYYNPLSSGTGTMIGNGLILTNAHVIKDRQNDISITTYTGEVFKGTLLRVDKLKDLALLSFDSLAEGFQMSDVSLYKGKPVMTIGQPLGLPQWSFSEGVVQTPSMLYTDTGGGVQWGIQTDASVKGGASGGPLLDDAGELIGVIRAGGDGVSYAIPMSDIKTFLEGIK